MKGMKRAVLAAVLAAALPVAASAQATLAPATDDSAKLAEADAILAIMFPPDRREQMFESILNQLASQVERILPSKESNLGDAGADAIMTKFRSDARAAITQVVKAHLPDIIEANAHAYTHQFSLDELKQIHAFAETPAGNHYMARAATLVNDPAYVAASAALADDTRKIIEQRAGKLKAELHTYFTAHPDAAKRVNAAAAGGK